MAGLLLRRSLPLILVLVACGGGDAGGAAGTPDHGGNHGGMGPADTSAFGEPGSVAMADRTVAVSMFDTFRYEPADVTVERNETIAFEVTNEGELPHEFVIGDRAFQADHEEAMTGMGEELLPDEPFAIVVEPGATESLAWTFSEPGTFEYACHVDDHYDGGMVGTISVHA